MLVFLCAMQDEAEKKDSKEKRKVKRALKRNPRLEMSHFCTNDYWVWNGYMNINMFQWKAL